MKYAIVILEAPEQKSPLENEPTDKWLRLVSSLRNTKTKTEGVQYIHPNVWTIPLQSGLPFLAECVRSTIEGGFEYRVLFLEDKPEWIHHVPLA